MIVRVKKTKNYTVMSNAHLQDHNLSLKAKGLLSIVLSLPDDWQYSIRGLATISRDNIDGTRTAWNELEAAGYIVRQGRERNAKGQLKSGVYDIYEQPPVSGEPVLENPMQANSMQETPTQQSTNGTNNTNNTKYLPTQPPLPPDGGTPPAEPSARAGQGGADANADDASPLTTTRQSRQARASRKSHKPDKRAETSATIQPTPEQVAAIRTVLPPLTEEQATAALTRWLAIDGDITVWVAVCTKLAAVLRRGQSIRDIIGMGITYHAKGYYESSPAQPVALTAPQVGAPQVGTSAAMEHTKAVLAAQRQILQEQPKMTPEQESRRKAMLQATIRRCQL